MKIHENIEIYNDDCMDVMAELKERGLQGKIDAVITDPPYNLSKKNNFHTMKGRQGIDFGKWDKTFDQTSWLIPAIELLKPGGAMIIFNSWENLGIISDALKSRGMLVKGLITWIKSSPMPKNKTRLYVNNKERAIWATKGKGWTFNPQKATYETGDFVHTAPRGKSRIHPTQKPVGLMEDIIKIHTNPKDVIFDPFMGSASTLVAAYNLDRYCIASDNDVEYEYFEKAKNRLINLDLTNK